MKPDNPTQWQQTLTDGIKWSLYLCSFAFAAWLTGCPPFLTIRMSPESAVESISVGKDESVEADTVPAKLEGTIDDDGTWKWATEPSKETP